MPADMGGPAGPRPYPEASRRGAAVVGKNALSGDERRKLQKINIELDQAFDLLRQRRALREFGRNPDEAEERPADVVEGYEG